MTSTCFCFSYACENHVGVVGRVSVGFIQEQKGRKPFLGSGMYSFDMEHGVVFFFPFIVVCICAGL